MSTQQANFSSVVGSLCLPSLEDISMLAIIKNTINTELGALTRIFSEHFSGQYIPSCLPTNRVSEITSVIKLISIPEVIESKFISLVHWVIDQYNELIYFVLKKINLGDDFSDRKIYIKHIVKAVKWSVNQTIDYQQSLLVLFTSVNERDENLKIMFDIACEYCLEDDLEFLWRALTPLHKNNILKEEKDKLVYCLKLYWVCRMTGDMEKFFKFAVEYIRKEKRECYYGALDLYIDVLSEDDKLGFLIAVLEGSSLAIKYFSKKPACADKELLAYLIEVYLKRIGCQDKVRNEDINELYLMLNQLQDTEITNKIFNDNCMIFLRLSIKYWPCHKYFGDLVKLSSDSIDHILFYKLMTALLSDLQEGKKYEMFLIRNLWRNISKEVKKSFSLFILNNELKDLKLINLWEYVNVDIMNMFLNDEEFQNFSMPYGKQALTGLVFARKYQVLDHWLKECLVMENAIITFMHVFIKTKSVRVFEYLKVSKASIIEINEFIDWAFKYEDTMIKEEIFRIKDEALELVRLNACLSGFKLNKWKDLDKFTDWILKNRNRYDDRLISFKIYVLQSTFYAYKEIPWDVNFANNFNRFLHYGVNNIDKLRIEIFEALQSCFSAAGYACVDLLKKEDWSCIESFLKFLSEYNVDLWKCKQEALDQILYGLPNLRSPCKYLEKLLYWTPEPDADIKKKILEIKKSTIKTEACDGITSCIRKQNWGLFNNLLHILFKDQNEEEDYAKVLFDFKKGVVKNFTNCSSDSWWFGEYFSTLINLGGTDEKEIWNAKKMALEHFKDHAEIDIITNLIWGSKKNFISSVVNGHENENDFNEFLWGFKEFLVRKLINGDNKKNVLTLNLFENFDKFNEFLNCNGFTETGLKDLKKFIVDEKGIKLIFYWISNNECLEISRFLDWHDDPFEFKQSVLAELADNVDVGVDPKLSFQKLEYFLNYKLDLHVEDNKKKFSELRNFVNEHCGIDICFHWFYVGKTDDVSQFMQWTFEPSENLKLAEFKIRLNRKHGAELCNFLVLRYEWEDLKWFLEWIFESYEDFIVREKEIIDLKIKSLVEDGGYELRINVLMKFLEWGFMSGDSLRKFKKSIFEETHPLNYFVTERKYTSSRMFQNWLKN